MDFVSPNEVELVQLASMATAASKQPGWPARRPRLPDASTASGGERGGGEAVGAPALAVLRRLRGALHAVLGAGVGHVVLTLGALGAALCMLGEGGAIDTLYCPALPAKVANCSGAGDALVAGCLAALQERLPLPQVLALGVAAATLAVESGGNVPEGLSGERVRELAREALLRHARLDL